MEQDEKHTSNVGRNVIASIGALVSLSNGEGGFYHKHSPPQEVLEALKYTKIQKYLTANLNCSLKIYQNQIPTNFGKITGALVFEARKNISHDGIFILVKGLYLPSKKYEFAERKRIPCLKFNILPYSRSLDPSGEDGTYTLYSGKEIYPLELEKRYIKTVEDLPPPIIEADGRLIYKFQVFLTLEGKQIQVEEVKVPFQGYLNLLKNPDETGKSVGIQAHLSHRKSYLSRRKFVEVSLSCDRNGYLAGESVGFLLRTKNPDKIPLKLQVDLLQKIWFQETTRRQSERLAPSKRLSVKMKQILVATTQRIDTEGVGQLIWKGFMRIPHGQAPSYKFDFLNSISYLLKLRVSVVGEEMNQHGNGTGEATIFIGTTRDGEEIEGGRDTNGGLETNENHEDVDTNTGEVDMPLLLGISMMCPFGSMNNINNGTSIFMTGMFGEGRQRSGSISSIQSTGSSSTASIFRMPPSYSRLFSRRSTLETLPPAYCELELESRELDRE
ncbi:unnamed protein product [Orchesella dallaii]|uniref:Arrestin C-terminal-like domain-containing protein n=1 Tax=Orchesella dallaii TaxID=48710 RepID=A0ABP1R9Z4_9HEXA